MKYTAALVAALAAATASAQDISIFPECSLQCIISGIGTTSCEATDFACVCNNIEAVKKAATPCVLEKCGVDTALNKVLPATEKFCADVGSGGGSSTGGGATTPATTKAPATSTSAEEEPPKPTETETETETEATTATSSPGSMVTPPPSGSAIPSTTGGSNTNPPTTRPTTTVNTAGAPAMGYLGSLGMLALGAVAAF